MLALDALLDKGITVATQVDFFYMDYIPDYLRVHINVHFHECSWQAGRQLFDKRQLFP